MVASGTLLLFFTFAVTASLAAWLLAPSEEAALIRLRAREVSFSSRPPGALEEAALDEPLLKRLLGPTMARVQATLLRRTPQGTRAALRARLREAGDPLDPGAFLALRLYAALASLALVLLMVSPRLLGGGGGVLPLALAGGAAYAGSMVPAFWLGRVVTRRKAEIRKSLPEVIDLLCVSVEAGLGLEGAIQKVAERYAGPLAQELGYCLNEMNLGKTREEAWRNLAQRVNLPDLSAVVSAIVQAERLGASLSTVLRVQAADLRERRRQRAEEQARQVPIKLLFPLVFFIFPALFVVILGPAILQILDMFSRQ